MHGPEVSELGGEGRKPALFRRRISDFFLFPGSDGRDARSERNCPNAGEWVIVGVAH
ncbi:MAG: hypothetical protein RLZZ232_1084 [Planctomycetota bacterium]|jgi:hypothetical protein